MYLQICLTTSPSPRPWAKGCYGRTDDTFSATPETNVVSGQGPHTEGASFVFGAGGHQGGEGCDVAGEWFIENVREELDAANEYFYDASAKELLFAYNGTGSPPSSAAVVVPKLANFVELRGSQERPVRNVTIRGITIRASRPTFMDPRGNPSGGDWSLERLGAVLLEGTEGVMVEDCLFTVRPIRAREEERSGRRTRLPSSDSLALLCSALLCSALLCSALLYSAVRSRREEEEEEGERQRQREREREREAERSHTHTLPTPSPPRQHLDGNAVSINGYNRALRVASNEFVNLGQNCIAAWGRADGNSGLAGNYPSGTVIEDNFAHEIGHIQKQVSF